MDFLKGLKNEFETGMVNEPSVFEALKVYWHYENGLYCGDSNEYT